MDIKEYASLADREQTYFWHVGRREILRDALLRNLDKTQNNKILDVGCGTGGDMLLLHEFGEVVGLDFVDEAFKFAKNKGFVELVLADVVDLPFSDSSFNIVVALDVMEHIKEDQKAFREVYRVLKPGGVFVCTVPSYKWLWSQHDEVLHHKRRYGKKELLQKLAINRFIIKKATHFVMLGLPINFVRKLRDKLTRTANDVPQIYDVLFPPLINDLLLFLLRCEKQLMRIFPLPFGTSIMVVAKKPAEN